MPDVVKHGWTHRPRSQGGTDPIDFPTGSGLPTALAVGGVSSRVTNAACAFDLAAWPDAYADVFGLALVSGATAKYITVTPGTYRVETCVMWTSDFSPSDFPFIRPTVYFPGAATEDVAATALPGPFFDDTQGIIYGQQFTAAEMDHHALAATQVFSWERDDFDEDTLGLGVRLEDNTGGPLAWGANIAITQLNPFKHVDRL